jgi:hypothetical protein
MTSLSSISLTDKVLHNHRRAASKDPTLSPPSGGPVRAEPLGDKVALISPTTNGQPVVYVAPLSYRLVRATPAEIIKLNGKAALSPADRMQKALDDLLNAAAAVEQRVIAITRIVAE